jgi:hypothetical protein
MAKDRFLVAVGWRYKGERAEMAVDKWELAADSAGDAVRTVRRLWRAREAENKSHRRMTRCLEATRERLIAGIV